MKKRILKIPLLSLFLLFLFISFSLAENSLESPSGEIPSAGNLEACPIEGRRIVYREKMIHQERQFRAEHPGCGGDIMMRKWQVIGLEPGYCEGEDCSDLEWLGEDNVVLHYNRYIPGERGEVFEEVGSWQKAWPPTIGGGGTDSEDAWMTETQIKEEYGEPTPFPVCQSDCLQAPPGLPGELGDYIREDPYYFNNPWLPEIIEQYVDGDDPDQVKKYIENIREKNLLGGESPLKRIQLPVKLFWWNIPGWHGGWIEDNQFKECEGPEEIACVKAYIIRFENINREDRPPEFHRFHVMHRLESAGYNYSSAKEIYEELIRENERAYQAYRREKGDYRLHDTMRTDRDNIIGCQNCGTEKEIWLTHNSFNPLDFIPLYDYERENRDRMRELLLNQFSDNGDVQTIINEVYDFYGRPGFFRSGVEHNYSLQATCHSHGYLEEDAGARGPEVNFSFETDDSPELISPIDPNWTSPYDPKEYFPNFDPGKIKTEEEDDAGEIKEKWYKYPAQKIDDDNFFLEERSITDLSSDYPGSLWNMIPDSLILQNQVPFRENLQWVQQWFYFYRDPGRGPMPASTYRVHLGEGIRVNQDNTDEYGDPVLEDCHHQRSRTEDGLPYCSYITKIEDPGLNFPLPAHRDGAADYFTLPEDSERDVYSWNVASCSYSAQTDCTNFSQLWRFQLNEEEEYQIFPPRNIFPPNIKEIGEDRVDEATVGFPLTIRWDERFGARSYVYRIKEKDSTDWEDIKIRIGNSISYGLGDFELDTRYEWDVKACWDEKVIPGLPSTGDPVQKLEDWVHENKRCSPWRSEVDDNAPFEFLTTGRPPELFHPLGGDQITFPIHFDWEDVPGAESYIFKLKRREITGKTMASLGLPNTPQTTEVTVAIQATDEPNYIHNKPIRVFRESSRDHIIYTWKVASCAASIEDSFEINSLGETEEEENLKKLVCGHYSDSASFIPSLNNPKSLNPGSDISTDRKRIPLSESYQKLSWDRVEGAKAYQLSVLFDSASIGDRIRVEEKIIEDNHYFHDFNEVGNHRWRVYACLDEDCSGGMKSESSQAFIEIYGKSLLGGVVPCGRSSNIFPDNPNLDSREPCRLVHLFVMINLIMENLIIKMLLPVSLVLLLLYTAYLSYTGFGKPDLIQKIYKLWGYAFKGYLLILLSWFIVGAFLSLIGYQFGVWWRITNLL